MVFLVLFSAFVRYKIIDKKLRIMDHAIRLSDCSKSVGNQKNDGVIIC